MHAFITCDWLSGKNAAVQHKSNLRIVLVPYFPEIRKATVTDNHHDFNEVKPVQLDTCINTNVNNI